MQTRGCITPHPESSATYVRTYGFFVFQAKHPPPRYRQEARSRQPSPTMSCLSFACRIPSTMACHCTVYSCLRQANLEAEQWQKQTRGACPKNEKTKRKTHTHTYRVPSSGRTPAGRSGSLARIARPSSGCASGRNRDRRWRGRLHQRWQRTGPARGRQPPLRSAEKHVIMIMLMIMMMIIMG